MIAPCWGPSDVPSSSTSAQADVNSSLLSGSCTTGITMSVTACAITVCVVIAATTPSSWPSAGTETRASSATGALGADSSSATPSTPALGDEGLHLRQAGGTLLHTPTRSFLRDRPGGAIRVAPTGLDFDVRLGGVICTAPAGLPHGVSWSGCFSSALAGVAPVPRRSSLLGRLGPSSHGLPQLRGLRHDIHDGLGLRRRVRRGARPGLEGFGRCERGCVLGNGPGAENWGGKAEVSRTGGSSK